MNKKVNCWNTLKPHCHIVGAKAETSVRMDYDDSKSKIHKRMGNQLPTFVIERNPIQRRFIDYPVREYPTKR